MALIAIGDVQGCADCLDRLLARLPADARLIFVGDLINRGPDSLGVLRRVRALGERAICLLGNHDLHLLAVAAGIRPAHDGDTLQDILAAPDAAQLVDWVRRRPLAHAAAGALFVHAGLLPPWSVEQTLELAAEVQARLCAPDYRDFLATMYGNRPLRWRENLTGTERWHCVLHALTRLRFVASDGTMDLKLKGSVDSAPAGWMPWFAHPQRASAASPVIFGHWSTLGLMLRDNAICIDTGCVWGRQLTALDWPSRRLTQVHCTPAAPPPAALPGTGG